MAHRKRVEERKPAIKSERVEEGGKVAYYWTGAAKRSIFSLEGRDDLPVHADVLGWRVEAYILAMESKKVEKDGGVWH